MPGFGFVFIFVCDIHETITAFSPINNHDCINFNIFKSNKTQNFCIRCDMAFTSTEKKTDENEPTYSAYSFHLSLLFSMNVSMFLRFEGFIGNDFWNSTFENCAICVRSQETLTLLSLGTPTFHFSLGLCLRNLMYWKRKFTFYTTLWSMRLYKLDKVCDTNAVHCKHSEKPIKTFSYLLHKKCLLLHGRSLKIANYKYRQTKSILISTAE